MSNLPWSERVPQLSVHPHAATPGDTARLASELMDANHAVAAAQERSAMDQVYREQAEAERDGLAALCERMREALAELMGVCLSNCVAFPSRRPCGVCLDNGIIAAALSLTPAQALAERDARVRADERDRCAEAVLHAGPCWGDKRTGPETCGEGGNPLAVCELHANLAAAIRSRTPAAGSGEKEA